tara:strand:- start:155 stop:451 length:297 start_codon:yes stop_codon:yes gene_type:complete
MKKSKKQKEKDLMKLHDLVMKKLDEAMTSVEASRQWKKVKVDYGFTMVMSWVVEECLYRWLDKSCIHTVKDELNNKLQAITSHKVIQAKANREEAILN